MWIVHGLELIDPPYGMGLRTACGLPFNVDCSRLGIYTTVNREVTCRHCIAA